MKADARHPHHADPRHVGFGVLRLDLPGFAVRVGNTGLSDYDLPVSVNPFGLKGHVKQGPNLAVDVPGFRCGNPDEMASVPSALGERGKGFIRGGPPLPRIRPARRPRIIKAERRSARRAAIPPGHEPLEAIHVPDAERDIVQGRREPELLGKLLGLPSNERSISKAFTWAARVDEGADAFIASKSFQFTICAKSKPLAILNRAWFSSSSSPPIIFLSVLARMHTRRP